MKVDQVIDILLNSSDESESLEDGDDESETIESNKKENNSQASFKTSTETQIHKEESKTNNITNKIDEKQETRVGNMKNTHVQSDSNSSDDSDDSDDLPLSKLIIKKGLNTSKTLNDSSSQIKMKSSANSSSKSNLRKSLFTRRPSIKKEKLTCLLKGIYDFVDSTNELIHMNENAIEEVSLVYSDLDDDLNSDWNLTSRTNEISACLDSDNESETNKENFNSIYNSLNCSPAIALEKPGDKYILSLKNLKRKKSFNY
jgi:hypothetical protein